MASPLLRRGCCTPTLRQPWDVFQGQLLGLRGPGPRRSAEPQPQPQPEQQQLLDPLAPGNCLAWDTVVLVTPLTDALLPQLVRTLTLAVPAVQGRDGVRGVLLRRPAEPMHGFNAGALPLLHCTALYCAQTTIAVLLYERGCRACSWRG